MSSLIHRVLDLVNAIGIQIKRTTNVIFPPAQREEKLQDARNFAGRHPKLAAFIALQFLFAAIPLTTFIIFAISSVLACLTTCAFVLITCAVICVPLTIYFIFIALVIGFCVLVPSLAVASFMATLSFVWLFAGWVVLRWFNNGEEPVKRGTRVGDAVRGVGDRFGLSGDATEKQGLEANGGSAHNDRKEKLDALTYGPGNVGGEWEEKWKYGLQQEHPGGYEDAIKAEA